LKTTKNRTVVGRGLRRALEVEVTVGGRINAAHVNKETLPEGRRAKRQDVGSSEMIASGGKSGPERQRSKEGGTDGGAERVETTKSAI